MESSVDLAECLRRWRAGDENGAEDLIRELYPLINRIVYHHLPRRDSAEDLTQEILMKLFSKLDQYKGDAPLTHWVSRLAVTTCLDRLRMQKVRPEIRWTDLSPEEVSAFSDLPQKELSTQAGSRDLIDRLLATLPAEQRQLIILADLEEKSLQEISDLTGWGISKTKMRLFRARQRLRETCDKLDLEKYL